MNLFENNPPEKLNIETTLQKSYLDYSMSVIIGRALPDVRDGLKPVHRRILFSMNELGLNYKSPYKKSARIVGDCLGKFHPHGDTSVYEALVRMAQDFSMRMPIIDGQGNFGSIDGDGAAAARYTEARLTHFAEELLIDIDKNTVDFAPNYDGSLTEPTVLPARVPNLLINGSNGIAVGMATNIPPHRSDEVIDGAIFLLDNPNASLDDLINIVRGPDFPTGGKIFGKDGIIEAYKTGRGRIKVRAKTHSETNGNRDVIVIDQLPYQVNKARLIEQIADLVKDKSLEGISDIRDESDRDGIRVVIELKKGAMREIIENNLYKSSNLEITFSINFLAIRNREPHLFNLYEILNEFITHRKSVVIRRTIFELSKAENKAHILYGLIEALKNIDAVVAILRQSENSESGKDELRNKFLFSDKQASAILDMKLHRLTSLEWGKLELELEELNSDITGYKAILANDYILKDVIRDELFAVKSRLSSIRRTEIEDDYANINKEDLIPNLPMVVTITNSGYIKRTPLSLYEKQGRGGKGKIALSTYEDDFVADFYVTNAHDTLLLVTNLGQLFWLKVYEIPESSRTAKGKAIVNLVQLRENEEIRAVIPTTDFDSQKSLIFFTKKGISKRTNLSEYANIRNNGIRSISLDDGDELVTTKIINSDIKYIAIFTSLGQAIRFEVNDIREIGRTARGVIAIRFKNESDFVVDAILSKDEKEEIFIVSENGLGKRSLVSNYRLTSRGGSGVISMKLTEKTGKRVIGALIVDDQRDLILLTESGNIIRLSFNDMRTTSRRTSGVILVRGDKVLSATTSPKADENEKDENGDLL
jgi:DNA gyrase subunit A